MFLNKPSPGTKEAASACNHSLMKLVTPEDDEDDEESQTKSSPPGDGTLSKKEGDLNGRFFYYNFSSLLSSNFIYLFKCVEVK